MQRSINENFTSVQGILDSRDWSVSPLGPRADWPETLKLTVSLIINSQFPMFIAWGPERIFLYNDAYAPILGEKHPNAFGMKFEVLWAEIWQDLLPLISSVDQGKATYVEDMRLVMHRFGYDEETFFTFSYSPIIDEAGKVLGLYCACFETTQKVNAEKALQKTQDEFKEERNRLLRILENFPEPITLISVPEMSFEFTNAKYRDFFLGGRDVLGKKLAEVIPEGEDQGFIRLLENVYLTGVPFRGSEMPVELRRCDGSVQKIFLNIVYEPVRGRDGQIEAILAGNFDITPLVAAKEQAQIANLTKTTFLANMSHEIRTPMTAVLGFTEMLRDPTLSETDRRESLERIEKSGRALLKIIDDILDISKVESGKLKIEKIQFSPFEVTMEVVSLLKLQAEQKGLTVTTHFSKSVPEFVSSDPARVRQILTNLIGNAIKFTTQGEVRIDVDAEVDSKKQLLSFRISDTGIGISESDQSSLFQPFSQAQNVLQQGFGGTGLGLVLSKRLAEQLGGDLSLESSQLGEGSRFVVTIEAGPFVLKKRGSHLFERAQESVIPFPVQPKILQSARVLVVDDVPDNQILMRKYLESVGANVDIASNGQEAIDKALQHSYDVIVMDVQMPVLDGIQATTRLRESGYSKPILALTAHAMKSEVQRSIEAGCDEHLTKPITRQNLVEAISRCL